MVMFLLAFSLQTNIDEQLKQSRDLINKKQYPKALNILNSIIKQKPQLGTAYLYRANCYELQNKQQQALDDYISIITHTNNKYSSFNRGLERLNDLCVKFCYLGCHNNEQIQKVLNVAPLMVLSAQREAAIFGQLNAKNTEQIAGQCSGDPQLQLAYIQQLINDQSTSSESLLEIGKAIIRLHKIADNGRVPGSPITSLLVTLQDLKNGDLAKAQKRITTLIHKYNDDSTIGAFAKFFKQYQNLQKVFVNIPITKGKQQQQDWNAVEQEINQLEQQTQKIATTIDQKFIKTIADLQKQLEDKITPIKGLSIQNQVQKALIGILQQPKCLAGYFKGKHSKECEYLFAQNKKGGDIDGTAEQLYFQALLLTIEALSTVKVVSNDFAKSKGSENIVDVTERTNELENQISTIYKLLEKAVKDLREPTKTFPRLEELLDEVSRISDKVLQIQLKLLRPDFYGILNVSRGASASDISRAYYQLARKIHPDRLPANATAEERKQRQQQFQQVAEAHSVLGDREKRQQYDQGQYNADAVHQRQSRQQQEKERARARILRSGGMHEGFPGGIPGGFPFPGGFPNIFMGGGGGGNQHIRININGQNIVF